MMDLEFFSQTNHKLSDNSSRVTVTSSSYYQNVFGNVLIDSSSNECHCWQFKILKNKESYGIDIGITNSNQIITEPSFTSNGYGYGLCSNGNIYSANASKNNNYKLKNCKQKYKQNDLILMTLDLNTKTLSFLIDNNKQINNKKITIKNIKCNENIKYKLAVYLSYKKDSIQLLNHIKTIPKAQKQINKNEKNYKQTIYKLKNIIKEKDLKLIETENKLKELQMKLNALENERKRDIENERKRQAENERKREAENKSKKLQMKLNALENERKRQTENENTNEIENEIEIETDEKESEKENEVELQFEDRPNCMQTLKEKTNSEDDINKIKPQVIRQDDSWRIDLKSSKQNKDKKRRRSVMELMENKAVSRRLSRSSQKLIQTQ